MTHGAGELEDNHRGKMAQRPKTVLTFTPVGLGDQ